MRLKNIFEVIIYSPKDSQLLAPWPSIKSISYIGMNPLQTKIKYVKIWNMFSFWWEGAKWTLARNNLSALWVGNCNCFILVFIMNMHPLLLLDNSQSKGSIRVLQQFGYRQFCCCRFSWLFTKNWFLNDLQSTWSFKFRVPNPPSGVHFSLEVLLSWADPGSCAHKCVC